MPITSAYIESENSCLSQGAYPLKVFLNKHGTVQMEGMRKYIYSSCE